MLIKIINHFSNDGLEYIEWDLYEGPDGIEHVHGYAKDLIQAFSKILEWQERISNDYYDDLNETTGNRSSDNQDGSERVGEGAPD